MKAMVLRGKNEPFILEERPDPKAGPGEAVARVIACGSWLDIVTNATTPRKLTADGVDSSCTEPKGMG